jgi:hypothetical protein
VYDEVTQEQYKSIVGSREEEFDFIEDDDGSGYVDKGEGDWDEEEAEQEEESEDDDDFEGEDEELRQGEWAYLANHHVVLTSIQHERQSGPKPKPGQLNLRKQMVTANPLMESRESQPFLTILDRKLVLPHIAPLPMPLPKTTSWPHYYLLSLSLVPSRLVNANHHPKCPHQNL